MTMKSISSCSSERGRCAPRTSSSARYDVYVRAAEWSLAMEAAYHRSRARARRRMVPAVPAAVAGRAGPPALAARELGLQALEGLDGRRVHAAQRCEVHRHEVAEQHEREDALDRRLAARLRAVHAGGALADQPRCQLDALLDARMR